MPLRLRNPLPGSLEPGPLSKRITDFLLTLAALIFLGTNRRIFERLLRRYAGLRDARRLPDAPRRLIRILAAACTGFLYLGIIFALASSWDAVWSLLAALVCYAWAASILSRGAWDLAGAFRGEGHILGVLRRVWRVIRDGAP